MAKGLVSSCELDEKRRVVSVFIFRNGMVATFDQNAMQMPKLQGPIFDVMQKIGRLADKDTKFRVFDRQLDVRWYFKKREASCHE